MIELIGPSLSFKLSSKVFQEESIECIQNNNMVNDTDDLVDKFVRLILKEKTISENKKQAILDFKITKCSNKISKNKKKKINRTGELPACFHSS